MKFDSTRTPLLLSALALSLVACSSGGGGGGTADSGDGDNNDDNANVDTRFTGASVETGDAIKELVFSWSVDGQADAFRLEANPDGASGYSPVDVNGDGSADAGDRVGGGATELSLQVALHRTDFANARYQVAALDGEGGELARSEELSIMDLTVESLIGYVKASNTGDGDEFTRVALSNDGDTLAVGAPFEASAATGVSVDGSGESDNSAGSAGAVYVFSRDGSGWSQQAYIKASNAEAGDAFGYAVALSGAGDTLVVGAPFEGSSADGVSMDGSGESDNSAGGAGAVYVFTREAGNWSQQAYVKASNPQADDGFGAACALSENGNILSVSAVQENSGATGVSTDGSGESDNSAENAGAVYMFTRDAGNWSQQAYVKASNSDADDLFGTALALSGGGDTLAVGALNESSAATGVSADGSGGSDNSAARAGAAYVFSRDDSGWSQQAYVKASNTGEGDLFGAALSLSGEGDTLAVSAPGEDGRAGAVYTFARNDDAWSQQAYVKASNPQAEDGFGFGCALSEDGNTLSVSAVQEASAATGVSTDGSGESDNSAGDAGAAYVFTREAGHWLQQSYVKAPATDSGDAFGYRIALSGSGRTLAVGAPLSDGSATGVSSGASQINNDADRAGAVFLY